MKSNNVITCVKHNPAKIKAGKREEGTKMLLDFFKQQQGKVKGLSGYLVLENMIDKQESIVLTFWQTKEDMDSFYRPDNKILSELVEKAKPLLKYYLKEAITQKGNSN